MKALQFIDPKKLSKECKITFIIGNGFDLGLGMKTKYTDVYDGYIKSPSSSDVIARFKKELESKAANNYEKWSDFEMGMAYYAQTLKTEDDLVECIRDFKGYMVDHLRCENQEIIGLIRDDDYASRLIKELDRSIERFYEGLTQNVINQFKAMIEDANIIRNYITFNYTMSLEAFLSIKAKYQRVVEATPIHIHGKLDEDVVLGIDNTEQLSDIAFSLTRKGRRAFIKTIFNEQYDKARVNAAKKIISESDIICIYGFSLGESDKTWIELLSNWLLEDTNHHLVVYQYDTKEYRRYNYDEIMDIEDEKKVALLTKLRVNNDAILNQIHIPIGCDIFNFSFQKVIPHRLPVGVYE